ncbi:hypothetical protein LXM94_21565, partial [Rhizobium sp. TRM95111]|nr:hypothetical protein [Rhizobium alarense]
MKEFGVNGKMLRENGSAAGGDAGLAHRQSPDPTLPQHLFVGSTEGTSTCTPDSEIHHVWPKFLVMVLLQGSQHFVMDGVDFRIDAGTGSNPTPIVFMLNVARFCQLQFINDCEDTLRKVMISAPLPWLQRLTATHPKGMPTLRAFFSRHLGQFSFEPGRHIVQLADQIMHPPPSVQGEVLTLYRQSHALDIMWQSCNALIQH